MDVHEFFNNYVLPDLRRLIEGEHTDQTNFERFLEVLKESAVVNGSRDFRARVTRAVVDQYLDDSLDFHEIASEAFDLLSDGECDLEKLSYSKGIDRITVEFGIKDPE